MWRWILASSSSREPPADLVELNSDLERQYPGLPRQIPRPLARQPPVREQQRAREPPVWWLGGSGGDPPRLPTSALWAARTEVMRRRSAPSQGRARRPPSRRQRQFPHPEARRDAGRRGARRVLGRDRARFQIPTGRKPMCAKQESNARAYAVVTSSSHDAPSPPTVVAYLL